MSDRITPQQFHASTGVEDWRVVGDGATTFIRTRSLAEAATLVQAISALPGAEAHKPDIDVRADGVTVRLITYENDYFGMSRRDVDLAKAISAAARKLGLVADPSDVESVLVIPGATDITKVMPFWRVALGYVDRRDNPSEDLVDPRGRGPALWFEKMEHPRGDGLGAIHVAVWVPFERAEARVKAALGAGGRMVRDEFAPAWWTLADAAGNEVDIASTKGRD